MTDEWTRQEGGNHYKDMAIQPSEFFEANGFGWLAASAMKYLCRYDKKGTPDLDLAKAAHYVSLLQQVQAKKSEAAYAEAQLQAAMSGSSQHVTIQEMDEDQWKAYQDSEKAAHQKVVDEPLPAWENELLHGVAWTTGDPEPGPEVQYVRAANSQVFKRVTIQRWRSRPYGGVGAGEFYGVTMWRAGMGVEIAWTDLLTRVPLPLTDCTSEFGAQTGG